MNAVFVWFIIALFFLILEMGHPGLFFFLSFFGGALSASFFAYFKVSFFIQMIIFLSVTLLSLLLLKIFVKKLQRSEKKTNVYALIGKHGIVVHEIGEDQPGYVNIQGELWMARSHTHTICEVNSMIQVIDVRGAHLIVDSIHV